MTSGSEKAAAEAKRPRLDWRYTNRRRRDFLQTLAETYDVEAACVAGRLTWPQVCRLRHLHPEFAAEFEQVIAAGYDRVEAMLLRDAGVGTGKLADPALAQALLKQRRAMKAESRPVAAKPVPKKLPGAAADRLVDRFMNKVRPPATNGGRGDGANGRGGAQFPPRGHAARDQVAAA